MFFDMLPTELRDLAAVARDVATERIAPLVPELERGRTFSPELRKILAGAGFTGLVVPERFGGVDTDVRAEVVVLEEISKVYPSASTVLTATWFPTKVMVRAADRPDAPAWLPGVLRDVASGDRLGAIAATEPEAGSDLGGVATTARRDGDEWVINGSKRFITNGGHADFYVVVARTGGPGPRGVSAFYVEADRPGVEAVRFEEKMGLHASATAEMVFADVRVPADHLLGPENGGFPLLMQGFDEGRIVVAALALGIAEGAFDAAVRYAGERRQFGRPIAAFQGMQFLIADMAIPLHAARSLVYDAAQAYVDGHPDAARLASIAKTYASDMAMAVTTDAVQVHGGYGYVTDFPVEMFMRDAKINQIYEGTNQIQRMIIARSYFPDIAR
ncbi:acyl-CoA dehydrogenase family protein [Micromonospora echinospora]|uniref:acyl-CoA dehydrogenase family protein n=1 Tax=Micromonospora echinospora TaxID=1877 RepID=UPI00341A055D